ncbi:four-carbon acid sugar kinase family protein [Halosimplex salinum]|uniref:four-carbon acid sugar kinase family protein n=1 Tax=Halosimplex salinum TaxID=1710538 RepID=UPI000F49FA9D|nr:four-carbon acid sugar kinase family protein [Halosimplex salinum]
MPAALVVADDLTGAMDTGHGFAAGGRTVRVRRSADGDAVEVDVLVVDTDSRDADPETAAAAVTRAVETAPAELVYKKVDSTLRGNVVAEVDAAVAASGADLAVVAPAFPSTGRTTEDGRHLVDGTPLAEAGYGVDESDLRAVFAPSEYPVAHLDTATVESGAATVADRLAELASGDGPTLVVCDARTERHLEAVAAGAGSTDTTPLYVGSGGLAAHVDVPGDADAGGGADTEVPAGPDGAGVLGVVGSVNERTLTQLATVDGDAVVRLDPAAAVRDPESTGRAAAYALVNLLDRQGRAVVTAATDTDDVATAERAATDLDGGDAAAVTAAERVSTALAAAARSTVADAAPAGLFLTGGDVAGAVLDALAADAIELTGESVADGVPAGRIATGPAAGTRVVTKAGGFGDERVIFNCLDALDR